MKTDHLTETLMRPPAMLPEDDGVLDESAKHEMMFDTMRRELARRETMIRFIKQQRDELADIVIALKCDLEGAVSELAAIRAQPKGA